MYKPAILRMMFFLGALNYCLLNNVQNQRQCGKSIERPDLLKQINAMPAKCSDFKIIAFLRKNIILSDVYLLHLKGFSKTKFDFIDLKRNRRISGEM